MSEPSSNKKSMKFKKQEIYPVFPPSFVSSNIDNIRDIEIIHVDLEEFIKRVRDPPMLYLI